MSPTPPPPYTKRCPAAAIAAPTSAASERCKSVPSEDAQNTVIERDGDDTAATLEDDDNTRSDTSTDGRETVVEDYFVRP